MSVYIGPKYLFLRLQFIDKCDGVVYGLSASMSVFSLEHSVAWLSLGIINNLHVVCIKFQITDCNINAPQLNQRVQPPADQANILNLENEQESMQSQAKEKNV